MLSEDIVKKFRAYILYGTDLEDLIQRIIRFVGGCDKIVVDSECGDIVMLVSSLCGDNVLTKSLNDQNIFEVLRELSKGMSIVTMCTEVPSPFKAICIIPVDDYNLKLLR